MKINNLRSFDFQPVMFRLVHFLEITLTRNDEIASRLLQIQKFSGIEKINYSTFIVDEDKLPDIRWDDFSDGTYLYLTPSFKKEKISKKLLQCQEKKKFFVEFPVYKVSWSEKKLEKIGEVITRTSEGYFNSLVRTIENINEKSQTLSFISRNQDSGGEYRESGSSTSKILLSIVYRILKNFVSSKLFEVSWHVGVQRNGDTKLNKIKKIIPNIKNHYFADPFVIEHRQKVYIFCEDYSIESRKGTIRLFEFLGNGFIDHGKILDEPFHLSFPYIFQYRSEHYMIPEATENGRLTLYKALAFPFGWVPHSVLPSKINGADPMIFEFQDKWWLFVNTNNYECSDYGSALSIYWSKTPLDGKWISHPSNPVIGPSNTARNAGMDFSESIYKRFAQIQEVGVYGAGLNVNEIEILNEVQYKERTVTTFYRYRPVSKYGFHHMSRSANFTALDFKIRKWKMSPQLSNLRYFSQKMR